MPEHVRVQPDREPVLTAILSDLIQRVGQSPELVRRITVRRTRTALQYLRLTPRQRTQPIRLPTGPLLIG